jgi:hypothetical protein
MSWGMRKPYLALELSNKQTLENLACFVAVAYILKGFGCILASYVKKDFFSTSVLSNRQLSVPFNMSDIPLVHHSKGVLFSQGSSPRLGG